MTVPLSAMEVEVGMKLAYLASLSLMTRMLSCPLEIGSSGINFMITTSKG
jgi:hypothetical protein